MKLLLSPALQVLFVATTVLLASGEEDHNHGDDLEAFVCADLNVTETSSCEEWCGPSLRPEWTYTTGHGHFEELHLAYLTGWMCHCYPPEEEEVEVGDTNATAVARQAVTEEKHCMDAIELTTCSSKGLADCGTDATMTCAELCVSLGLGLGVDANVTADGNSTSDRFLSDEVFMSVITDDHFCAHHEEEEERRRRFLHEGEHHAVTLCYCNSLGENDAGSTVVCSDASLAEEHTDDETSTTDSATSYKASAMSLVVMAGSLLTGTSILVAAMY